MDPTTQRLMMGARAPVDFRTWSQTTSAVINQILRDVASNGSLFVAVGDSGSIITSSDGYNWTTRTSGTTANLRSVIWANNIFLAASGDGTTVYSSDGILWTVGSTGGGQPVNALAWNGSVFVAVGVRQYSSTDGITWTDRTPIVNNRTLNAVVWSSSIGRFIGVGDSGGLLTSPNGTFWDLGNSGTSTTFRGIEWNGSLLVAVGDNGLIRTSTDATSWTTRSSPVSTNLLHVVWSSSRFYVTGDDTSIIISSSGTTSWALEPTLGGATAGRPLFLSSIAADGDLADSRLVAVGGGILPNTSLIITAKHTTTAAAFTRRWDFVFSSDIDIISATYTGAYGYFILVAPPFLLSTQSGSTFQILRTGLLGGLVTDVAYAAASNTYVAVGDNNLLLATTDDSSTGINSVAFIFTWSTRFSTSNNNFLRAVTSNGTGFVAVGNNGAVVTSSNGTASWSYSSSNVTSNLNDVTWTGNTYVAVGNPEFSPSFRSIIIYSSNGSSWNYSNNSIGTLRSVVQANTQTVVVGDGGSIATSVDLSSWTTRTSGTADDLFSVFWQGGKLVAVGEAGTIITSDDNGNTWTPRVSSTTNNLRSVWSSNSFALAVGDNLTVLRNP
jgi:photosystem II stability/assembly factor-like uncharacterized protein